ncbi:hypothetical protein WJX77_002875 [Trebouxia sp. C0004]
MANCCTLRQRVPDNAEQISAKGNRYIITCVDYLTKNVEVRAVPNKASDTVADFFWEDIICRDGNVATVISDRGRELSGSFEELLDRCFIDHRLTSPHHPQSNGLTERFNETLTIALRKMVTDHPEDWDMHLPAILMGYRGSIQASTRFSPFYLLPGYEMPAMEPIHAARIAAHSNISQAQERNKRSYARRTNHSAEPTASRKLTAEEKEASEAGPSAPRADRHAVQPGDFVMVKKHEKDAADNLYKQYTADPCIYRGTR